MDKGFGGHMNFSESPFPAAFLHRIILKYSILQDQNDSFFYWVRNVKTVAWKKMYNFNHLACPTTTSLHL